MTSWPARNGLRSCNHLAVVSVVMPSSSARTCAAAAEGASPITEPGPCSASQAWRSARSAVVLPAPAGPTSTSTTRPEVAIACSAGCCSLGERRCGARGGVGELEEAVFGGEQRGGGEHVGVAGPEDAAAVAALQRRGGCGEVGWGEPQRRGLGGVDDRGRGRLRGRRWWRTAGPSSCRDASACRFQCRQVARCSPTTSTTRRPTAAITSGGRSSARCSRCGRGGGEQLAPPRSARRRRAPRWRWCASGR